MTNEPAREESVSQPAMCSDSVNSSASPAGIVPSLIEVIVNSRVRACSSASPATRTGSRPSLAIRNV